MDVRLVVDTVTGRCGGRMNEMVDQQPDPESADAAFLGVVLPQLRADDDHENARALVADYVRRNVKAVDS